MLKLTSLIENVFCNISDVIRHVLETKRNTRKEKRGKNMTDFSYNLYAQDAKDARIHPGATGDLFQHQRDKSRQQCHNVTHQSAQQFCYYAWLFKDFVAMNLLGLLLTQTKWSVWDGGRSSKEERRQENIWDHLRWFSHVTKDLSSDL